MSSSDSVEFSVPSPECCELQHIIEAAASQADDTLDLETAFLLIRDISLHNITEPIAIAQCFLDSLEEPYSRYLSSNLSDCPWGSLSPQEAEARMIELLTQGVSNEIPVFDRLEPALDFTRRLMQAIGIPDFCLTNVERYRSSPGDPVLRGGAGFSVFPVGHCWDEGVILISSQRIGLLWFLGYD